MSRFNSEMLVMAREVRALSQEDLALKSGVSQSKVSKVEAGLLLPSDEDLSRFAEAICFPIELFFYSGRRAAAGSSCIYHRKRQSLPARELNRLHARLDFLRIQIQQLLLGVEFENANSIYRMDIDAFDGDATAIARMVRQAWAVPPGPIINLTAAIENAGGIVVKASFGTDKIDAMSQWPKGMPPIFFVNADAPGDRLRFSLCHELGHVVMHAVPTGDLEREADRFAAELLMPGTDILPELTGRVDIQKLAAMKPRWHVAMQAIARRAFDLDVITERQYRSIFMVMGKMGWRKKEPVSIPQESPAVIPAVLEVYLKTKGYSLADLHKMAFCRDANDFPMAVGATTQPKLRIAQ